MRLAAAFLIPSLLAAQQLSDKDRADLRDLQLHLANVVITEYQVKAALDKMIADLETKLGCKIDQSTAACQAPPKAPGK